MPINYEGALIPSEKRRCRHCLFCIYFSAAGNWGCCNYYLVTGIRRPCKGGQPDCPVRKYPPNFKMPSWYKPFVERIDAEEAHKQRERDRLVEEARQGGWDPDHPPKKKRGRKPNWDHEYGLKLYKEGYYFFEIAEVLQVKRECVVAYATNNLWNKKYPNEQPRHRHDLVEARRVYEAWLREREKREEVSA